MARTVAGTAPRTNRRFLIIAALLAVLTGSLFYAWMAANGGDDGGVSVSEGSEQVVVARAGIKQRTKITADMLQVKAVPTDLVLTGSFASIDDVVGKVTKLPVEANEQVIASAVVDTENPVGEALAQLVPTGKRAYSVNASQVRTAGGLVLPGDYIDVIWVCCTEEDVVVLAKTVVQNVQVVAVAQNQVEAGPATTGSDGTGSEDPVAAESGEAEPEAITATLLVTDEQAHHLIMAENTGEIRLALRGVEDTTVAPSSGNDDFTLVTELLPFDVLRAIPDTFWPEGYKPEEGQ
jgi:pilus assembly protein CpaB